MNGPSIAGVWFTTVACCLTSACCLASAGCLSEAAAVAKGGSTVDQVCDIAARQFHTNRSEIHPSTSLADLDGDDLDCVELIMELEQHFHVSLDDDELEAVSEDENWLNKITMGKLAAAVERQK